ncbi:MAG: O-antigen ligase family protein, partial [Bacteroidales bacterium]|nr:O-antigen ligase family protein [Bacteroidales bacterium]
MIKNATYYIDWLEIAVLCYVAFFIPFDVYLTPLPIAVLGIFFFGRKRNYAAVWNNMKKLSFWVLILPFVLYLTGIFLSEDKHLALKNTETALSLFAFPFIATSFSLNNAKYKERLVFGSFVTGIIAIMAIRLAKAFARYFETNNINLLFYSDLIDSPHHHSYYVFFAIVVFAFFVANYKKGDSRLLLAASLVCMALMVVFLGFLAAKVTLLTFALFIFYLVVKVVMSKRIPKFVSVPIAVCAILLLPVLYSTPMVKYRVNNMLESLERNKKGDVDKYLKRESTSIRIAAFMSACDLISENFVFGTGQGDVIACMKEKMQERVGEDYSGTCAPHNQFLRSFASFGILGFLFDVLLFVVMFRLSIRSKDKVFLWWTISTLIFFVTEDMLCIINGIVFFSMFTAFFLNYWQQNPCPSQKN